MSRHEQSDLMRAINESSPDRFRSVYSQWIQMSRYDSDNAMYSLIKRICDPKRTPKIEKFLGELTEGVKNKVNSHDYEGAVGILSNAFQTATEQFSDDHATTLHRFIWYRTGHLHERRATYGDLSTKPIGDNERTACFLKAATCYMYSDLQLGYVTDYSSRIAESLLGAGPLYGSFAVRALQKLLGQDVIIVGTDDPGGQAIVKGLTKRSQDVRRGSIPNGGNIYIIGPEDLPPSDRN